MVESIKALVRPMIAFGLVGGVIYGFAVGLVSAEVFIPMATLVVVFYFEERSKEKAVKAVMEAKK